ncbi:MAG: adenylosuccinate synthetase [Arthrobacter sp.]|nr:adenylosuccinate synthetase [Arthrobacter sp.]
MGARAEIVVGLGFGDEGKGAAVDYLCTRGARPADRVVRFNGGGQAAHTVVAGPLKHTFSTFASGTLAGVPGWVGPRCTFAPGPAAAEWEALRSLGLVPRLSVSEDALLTTPLHVAANLARERARGDGAHGTTGTGFGETIGAAEALGDAGLPVLRAGDLGSRERLVDGLEALRDHLLAQGLLPVLPGADELARLADRLRGSMAAMALGGGAAGAAAGGVDVLPSARLLEELSRGHTVFEGAQGLGLDENLGTQPHTTWSTTTPAPARRLAAAAGVEDVRALGCLRTYSTRHGAGPLPGEGLLPFEPEEPDNPSDGVQGAFRTGAHDPEVIQWALRATHVDALCVSHTDVFDSFVTTRGPLALDAFAPLECVAAGPARGDRLAP